MKILQGVTGQAGQPHALAAGLREIGLHAETLAVSEHKFAYPVDHRMDLSGANTLSEVYKLIHPIAEKFDVFHFHARSFLIDWPDGRFPAGMDLILLKMLGKKIFFHYRGQEIRLASVFAEKNPYHYVNEASGQLFTKMPDSTKLRMRDFITSICDGVFVTDPELQTYVPGSIVVPRALDPSEWEYVGVSDREIPVVMHAPSRRGVKGTQVLLRAVDELKSEGVKFDFRLVEHMTHAEASRNYREADIIVDQLRIGWYGVLACEAMALGKPVIAYIRDDLWEREKNDLPLVNANPDNIKSQLKMLINSRDQRKLLSNKAREYFLRVHSSKQVATLLKSHYNETRVPFDMSGVAAMLDEQTALSMRGADSKGGRTFPEKRPVLGRIDHLVWTYRSSGFWSALDVVKLFIMRRIRRLDLRK